jgi:hypothetical protein
VGLSFVKKAAAGAGPSGNVALKTASGPKPLGWMKRGDAAKEAAQQEEARAELAKQGQGMFRFWMPEDSDRRITFLDGDLGEDGILDVLAFYEHSVLVNGDRQNFVCTAEADTSQPCPICATGEKPALVHAFTVLDHTPYTIKKGPNAGKTITNSRKLFVAKRTTMAVLSKIAVKRDGLAGCTFDVSRIGDKSAGVGSQFDFTEKLGSYEEIATKYGLKPEEVAPANYEDEIRYVSPEDLIALGVGKAPSGIGYEKGISGLKSKL